MEFHQYDIVGLSHNLCPRVGNIGLEIGVRFSREQRRLYLR